MSVAIYVTSTQVANALIPWGARLARARHVELAIVIPKRSRGKTAWCELRDEAENANALHEHVFSLVRGLNREQFVCKQDIAEALEKSDHDRIAVSVHEVEAPSPEQEFAANVAAKEFDLLLIHADEPGKANSNRASRTRHLFEQVPCETVVIRGACPPLDQPLRILVATQGDSELSLPLKRARQLARRSSGKVTVLYVRRNDDLVARDLAENELRRLIGFDTAKDELFEAKIEFADSMLGGVKKQNLEEYDLVMVGSTKSRVQRQMFRGLEDTPESKGTTAVSLIREAVPMYSRLWSRLLAFVRGIVPQMERPERMDLVRQLDTSSRFNFDFIVLISLSTAIAGLGLIDNSAAVVIGAMLVAPLMTPLVGSGFSLAQGNVVLVKTALRSVALGFAVAFCIGLTLGILIPGIAPDGHLNDELSARCEPNLLHLLVALFSGIAAAYANGRKDLVGALPGVAIAAALVPPIATSGIAFSIGQFKLAGGASLLFFTNIVAIILGTAFTFWMMGVNIQSNEKGAKERKPERWPVMIFAGLFVVSLALAIYLPSQNDLGADNTFGIEPAPESVQSDTQPDDSAEAAEEEIEDDADSAEVDDATPNETTEPTDTSDNAATPAQPDALAGQENE